MKSESRRERNYRKVEGKWRTKVSVKLKTSINNTVGGERLWFLDIRTNSTLFNWGFVNNTVS